VSLTRQALRHLRDGGSITLTSGRFEHPIPGSTAGALANAGLEAFVRSAALEMPRGPRINAVSPGWVRVPAQRDATDFCRAMLIIQTSC
jgi:NAD(P)-dependent dehydrogenase (short-subunit alcohol dehydrogenase family)